jgi:hypothetical protein
MPGGGVIDAAHAQNPARAASWFCFYHVINRGNGRATIFNKAQDYFGLRLFQMFQTFNRYAHQKPIPFQTFLSFKTFQSFECDFNGA